MRWLWCVMMVGCAGPEVSAVVQANRDGHWLDRPFPADELINAQGRVDMSILPEMPTSLGDTIIAGWAGQATESVIGFSPLAGIYFQLDGPIEVEAEYAGLESDPVQLFSLDSDHRVPVEVSFVADAAGDPLLTDNLLQLAPHPVHPLRSGERYAAIITRDLVRSPEDWEKPEELPKNTAVGTVFTVQDIRGQLEALGEATDAYLDAHPEMLQPANLRRVVALTYAQGFTPGGDAATISTATYESGESTTTYLYAAPEVQDVTIDLVNDWPMTVWEAEIQTVAFRDLSAQPWANSGPALLLDFHRRNEGWFDFDAEGNLTSEPAAESMRVVISIPKTGENHSVMTWDHGTGGHAYSAVQRLSTGDDGRAVAEALATAGTAVVGRDQPLYGSRYSLIEDGFGGSLGFYNIGNLPAFRDNQRQGGVDHRVLFRFCEEVLPGVFETDPERIGAFGHSLGSVTAHNGLVLSGGQGSEKALMSGTGGYFTYYVLDTGLLGTDNDVVTQLEPLVGQDVSGASPSELVSIMMGLPEEAWPNMNRFHPAMGLFQMIMDPSDPLALAPEQPAHETIVLGYDDWQVPNQTTRWLHEGLPSSELIECMPASEYDGHYCTYREKAGLDAIHNFAKGL